MIIKEVGKGDRQAVPGILCQALRRVLKCFSRPQGLHQGDWQRRLVTQQCIRTQPLPTPRSRATDVHAASREDVGRLDKMRRPACLTEALAQFGQRMLHRCGGLIPYLQQLRQHRICLKHTTIERAANALQQTQLGQRIGMGETVTRIKRWHLAHLL